MRELSTPSWLTCSPHTLPLQGLSLHILCSPLFLESNTDLGFASCNSNSYNNKQLHPQYRAKPVLGITWNSCCSPCPHRARRATCCMWGAIIFQGQVQSIVCPCEISVSTGATPLQQSFIKDLQKPPQAPGPPLQGRGLLQCSQSTHMTILLNLRTEHLQYAV